MHSRFQSLLLTALVLTMVGATSSLQADEVAPPAVAPGQPHRGHLSVLWPASAHNQELAAYMGSGLLPVPTTDRRPTVAERLAMPPFANRQSGVSIDMDLIDEDAAAALMAAAQPATAQGVLSFGSLVSTSEDLFLKRRYNPATKDLLYRHIKLGTDPLWLSVDVKSTISKGVRRLRFHVRQVLEAKVRSLTSGNPVEFAAHDWLIAEHIDSSGAIEEVHTMGKRTDHEWDYGLYDSRGYLQVAGEGDATVRSPTTCWNCHRTSERVSPFSEFPAPSPAHPDIQPEVLMTLTAREATIVNALAGDRGRIRARRPSDDVMGHYAGLAALHLEKLAAAGPLPSWAVPVWDTLRAHVPELGRPAHGK